MAHRPTNPSPYLTCADASKEIAFRFLVADMDVYTGAEITIMLNDIPDGESEFRKVAILSLDNGSASYKTCSYDSSSSGVWSDPIPIDGEFPKEIKGGNKENSYVEIPLPADVLENGVEYKWRITSIDDTREFWFETSLSPSVAISDFSAPLKSCVASFSGVVKNCSIDYYRWELQEMKKDGYVTADATDNQYDINIAYKYDRFMSGESYRLLLYVKPSKWSDEIVASTRFDVAYAEAESAVEPVITVNPYRNSITIDLSNIKRIMGDATPTDGYSLKDGIAHLNDEAEILYDTRGADDLVLPTGTGYAARFKIDDMFFGDLISIEDEDYAFTLGYSAGFYYTVNGERFTINMDAYGYSTVGAFSSGEQPSERIYILDYDDVIDLGDKESHFCFSDSVKDAWWLMKFQDGVLTLWKQGDEDE